MDTNWMRERLIAYAALCEKQRGLSGQAWGQQHQAVAAEVNHATPTVRKILSVLEADLADQLGRPEYLGEMTDSLRAVHQGLGILDDMDEVTTRLAPDSPSLVADKFHPTAWRAAAALWDTGQFRVAVQQAVTSLSAHIAARASTSLADRELVAQVFSPNDPGPNQARLHFPGDRGSRTWRSRQEGLHLTAQGAFAGIRNLAVHTEEEWSEQVALEQLAVLSVVARWADETELVTT